jgi:hypothetical protein
MTNSQWNFKQQAQIYIFLNILLFLKTNKIPQARANPRKISEI